MDNCEKENEIKNELLKEEKQLDSKLNEENIKTDQNLPKFLGMDIFLIILMLNNFLMNACFTNMGPFFPKEAKTKGVSQTITGFIFSAQPLGVVITSLILAQYLSLFGRKKMLTLGILLNIIASAILGLIYYVEEKYTFIIIALLARLCQGIGRSCYLTSTISMLTIVYPNTLQKKIANIESMTGLGIMMGPLIGSGLYNLFGYPAPFFAFSSVFILTLPFSLKGVTNKQAKNNKKQNKVSFLKVLQSRKIVSYLFIIIIANIDLSYLGPSFANHLEKFGVGTNYAGLIFPIGSVTYVITIKIISKFSKNESIRHKFFVSIGGFIHIFSQIMLGPIPYIFPEHLSIVIMAQVFLGISFAFILLPFVPEMVHLQKSIYPNETQSLNDFASGMFSSALAIGGIAGPIMGSSFEEILGFNKSTYIFSGLAVLSFLVYISFGNGIIGFFQFIFKKKNIIENNKKEDFEKQKDENFDKINFIDRNESATTNIISIVSNTNPDNSSKI